METINYNEFKKIDLRVVKIISATRVKKSEKLLKLEVDLGTTAEGTPNTRQIIAGIGIAYAPEDIMGKSIVIVANLAPRMLMGLESQGMVLAAHGKTPVLLIPERETPSGASIS
ncbi:MAG: methionine--tRNA ligase subunit beta [Patescibacteria group bacterium]